MTREEAFEIAWPVLRRMVLDENPSDTVAEAAAIWGSATVEQEAALAFLERSDVVG